MYIILYPETRNSMIDPSQDTSCKDIYTIVPYNTISVSQYTDASIYMFICLLSAWLSALRVACSIPTQNKYL